MDRALVEAARSAQAQNDWRGLAFAMQVFGLALELRGRPADADRSYAGAVQVIRARSVAAPPDAQAAPELARSLLWLGSVRGRRNGEVAQIRMDLEESLRLREAAAFRNPNGMRETIDLVSCHLQLNMLFHQNGFGAEAKDHLDAAMRMRLYGAMADRSQFTPSASDRRRFDRARRWKSRWRAYAGLRICGPCALSATHAGADEGNRQGAGRAPTRVPVAPSAPRCRCAANPVTV